MQRNYWVWHRVFGAIAVLSLLSCFIFFHFFFASFVKQKLINIFRHELHTELQLTVSKEGFFFPKMIFRDIHIKPLCHEKWHCTVAEITASFTIFRLLTYWNIPLIVIAQGVDCFSVIEQQHVVFMDFCTNILQLAPDFFRPTVQALFMSDCKATLFDPIFDIHGHCSFHGNSISVVPATFELHGAVLSGMIGSTKRPDFISDITGVMDGVFGNNVHKITLQMKGIFTDCKEPFTVRGQYADHAGRFSFSTAHPYCFVDPIIYTKQVSKLSAKWSLSFLQRIFQIPLALDGMMQIQLSLDTQKKDSLQGLVTLQDGKIVHQPLIASLKMNITEKNKKLSGPITTKTALGQFEGNFIFDAAALDGQIELTQKEAMSLDLFIPRRFLDHRKGAIHCILNKEEFDVTATGELVHTLDQGKIDWKFSNNLIFSDGMFVKGYFGINMLYGSLLWKELLQGQWSIIQNKKSIFSGILHEDAPKKYRIESQCRGSFIKQWLHLYSDQYAVSDDSAISLIGNCEQEKMEIEYTFSDGVFDIPYLKNSIIKAQGNAVVDFVQKEVVIPHFDALCTKGFLSSNNGQMQFNDMFFLESCNVPLSCTTFGVSLHNNADALLTASLLYRKKKAEKTCYVSGNVLLHQGILRNDAFVVSRHDIKDSFLEKYIVMQDLHVVSEYPIRIDTKQLYTDVMLDVFVTGSLLQPHFHGQAECLQGELLFPYQSLYISRGKILFAGGTFQDAALELFAKNVVKNYEITMHAAGSLSNYTLLFDATPYLSQSQIFSLLLFGSDQESVSIFAPSLFSHNIKLGSFDIRFIPGFSDKSSRGGIRGALEIAVNKRLRATIQKNFTLSEDTRFELEYTLTDAVSLRMIRDERRDVGGEIEFQWKF